MPKTLPDVSVELRLAGCPLHLAMEDAGVYTVSFAENDRDHLLALNGKSAFRGKNHPIVSALLAALPQSAECRIPLVPHTDAWRLAQVILVRARELCRLGLTLHQRKAKRRELVLSLWDGYTRQVDAVTSLGVLAESPYGIAHGFYLVLEEIA